MGNGVVNFIINCFKKGNGLEAVKKDVAEAKSKADDLSRGLRELGGAANIAGRALRAAMTGGVWTLAAEGVKLFIDKWKEWKERAITAARDTAREYADALGRASDAVEKKFKSVVDAMATAAARAKELMGLENTRGDTHIAVETADLNEQERRELARERNESERAIIKANYEIKRARVEDEEKLRRAVADVEESENNIDRANAELLAAREAATRTEMSVEAAWAGVRVAISKDDAQMVKTAEEAMAKATTAAAAARDRVARASEKVASAETANEAALLRRNKLKEEIVDREQRLEYNLAEAKRKAAEETDKRTKNESKAAELYELHDRTRTELLSASCEAERAVIRANEKVEEALIEAAYKEGDMSAKEAVDKARFELAETIDSLKEKERKELLEKNAKEQENAVEDAANNQIDALNNAIKQLTDEIKELNDSRDKAQRGVGTERGVNNWGPGYNWGVDANGVPDNFIDWNRAMRFAERAERDRKNRDHRDQQFQQKMKDLQDKLDKRGEKALSERERAQLKAWKEFQEAKTGRERREKEIEKKQQQIDMLRKQMANDLKNIRENLKQALEMP